MRKAPAPIQSDPVEIARFKHLTEAVLPALARQHRWPIRMDHCFKRICLDAAYQDVWYNHCKRPAERHIAPEPLARAVTCAQRIAADGLSALDDLNQASLAYRGKLP